MLDAGVLHHLAQHAAVAAAHDQHVLGARRVREHRDVREHLLVRELVALRQLDHAVQHEHAAVRRGVEHEHVLELGLLREQHVLHLEPHLLPGPHHLLLAEPAVRDQLVRRGGNISHRDLLARPANQRFDFVLFFPSNSNSNVTCVSLSETDIVV